MLRIESSSETRTSPSFGEPGSRPSQPSPAFPVPVLEPEELRYKIEALLGRMPREKLVDTVAAVRQFRSRPRFERLAAVCLAESFRQSIAHRWKAKPTTRSRCWMRLFGKHCPRFGRNGEGHSCLPPGGDHPNLWCRKGKAVLLTLEPYPLTFAAAAQLVDWCRQNGLEADFSAASPYFAGATMLIEIHRPGVTQV